MGDQKDHMPVHKKETESAVIESESVTYETATESLPPPSLQLKAVTPTPKEEKKEEGIGGEKEDSGAFQFSLSGPPSDSENGNSKLISSPTIQRKGIAEPFRMPIIQKKEAKPEQNSNLDKPSFKL